MFNGAGVFSLVSGNPVVTGTVISSTWANSTLSDIAANGLTLCLTKDGQQTPTNNIPMGGFRITGLGAGTVRTDAAQLGQVQDGGFIFINSVAGTDTITGVTSPATTSYVAGQTYRFVAAGTNTTSAVTLNLNSLGAKSVTQVGTLPLTPGALQSGAVVTVTYDGTQFQAIGTSTNFSTSGIAGLARKVNALQGVASTSLAFTADEVIVETSLGGTRYCISNLSATLNVATVGANGMDTGSAPVSGYVAVYVIYNPATNTAALLAQTVAPTAATSIYSGANMPSGYTASGLICVIPTNASSQIPTCSVVDRRTSLVAPQLLSSNTNTAGVQTPVSTAVLPANARYIGGLLSITSTAASNLGLLVAANTNAIGVQSAQGVITAASQPVVANYTMNIVAPRSFSYATSVSAGTCTAVVTLAWFEI